MLHIHGDADLAISFDNLARLATVTGGDTVAFAGADHLESLRVDRDRYTSVVLEFLGRALEGVDVPASPTRVRRIGLRPPHRAGA